MMKGGRQAKLQAKEKQAQARAERLFAAFNKESLRKLRAKIMPEDSKTPSLKQTGESHQTNGGLDFKQKSSLSKTMGRKSVTKKLAKTNETELLRSRFIELFSQEMANRKMMYYKAKEDKDIVFRELEHLKTASRLMESRLKKKQSKSAYPLKLDVSLVKAQLEQNIENIKGNDNEENLEIFYKMDNGKDVFTSDSSDSILNPTWDNVFTLTLQDSNERLYFQMYAREMNTTAERLIDTFDISATIIAQNLAASGSLTDNISTSLSNHFTLCIKDKTEVNPKLQNFRTKIAKLENDMLQVEPPYKDARAKFEKFLNLKGIELLNEWGVCGNDIKLIKKSKGKVNHDEDETLEETKVHELDLDQNDRSFLNTSTLKTRKKRAQTAKGSLIGKTPERNTKHKITKSNIKNNISHIAPTHKVDLEEIGSINPPNQNNSINGRNTPQKNSSTERINKIINKRHLHKPYKTSATISEKDEFYYTTPTKKVNLNDLEDKDDSNMHNSNSNDSQKVEMAQPKLTADALKTSQLGSKRSGLGSSLINFAMQDVGRVNKVKSEYNHNPKGGAVKVGSMMNAMNINNTLTGMLMMNNGLGGQVMNTMTDDDNCSLVSGNTMQTFQNIANPLFTLPSRLNHD